MAAKNNRAGSSCLEPQQATDCLFETGACVSRNISPCPGPGGRVEGRPGERARQVEGPRQAGSPRARAVALTRVSQCSCAYRGFGLVSSRARSSASRSFVLFICASPLRHLWACQWLSTTGTSELEVERQQAEGELKVVLVDFREQASTSLLRCDCTALSAELDCIFCLFSSGFYDDQTSNQGSVPIRARPCT